MFFATLPDLPAGVVELLLPVESDSECVECLGPSWDLNFISTQNEHLKLQLKTSSMSTFGDHAFSGSKTKAQPVAKSACKIS